MTELNQIPVADSGWGMHFHAGAVEQDGRVIVLTGLSGRAEAR